MVNTVVLYDVPHRVARQRVEALLRAHAFVWLFPHARWSSRPIASHDHLARSIRSRLAGETYRLVFLEIPARNREEARWLTGALRDRR